MLAGQGKGLLIPSPRLGAHRKVDTKGEGGREAFVQSVLRLAVADAASWNALPLIRKDSLHSECGPIMPRYGKGKIVFLAVFQRNNAFLRECMMCTFHSAVIAFCK